MVARSPLLVLLVTIALIASGCLGSDADPAPDPGVTDGDAMASVPAPLVQTWEGHMIVGAAFEIPAHFTPSDQLVKPIWSTGFVIEITEAPDVLEIQVDWTGTADLMMMTHAPHGAERDDEHGWSEYTTHTDAAAPFALQGPLCMRIPAADLVADVAAALEHGAHPYWYPMVHSHAGADVRLTFTVTSVGGNVTIPDAIHGHETTVEELQNIVETEDGPKRPWEPCALQA